MFDITSSKLLILGIVALLVIGPKDLPALLRTIGKYMGIIKRQAAEFRAQFDEAMRESELEPAQEGSRDDRQGDRGDHRARPSRRCRASWMTRAPSVDAAMDDPAKTRRPMPERARRRGAAGRRRGGAASAATAPLNGAGHAPEPEPRCERVETGARRAGAREERSLTGAGDRRQPRRGARRDRGVQGAADGSPDRAAPRG